MHPELFPTENRACDFISLGHAIYELIENADRWGRRDFDEKSIKGAFIHLHTREGSGQTTLAKQQEHTPVLKHFLDSNPTQEDYLEISIW